jgi:hypothetical protein
VTLTLSPRTETSPVHVIPGVDVHLEVPTPGTRRPRVPSESADIVEEWGMQSFPASDPPSNW